MALPKKKQTRSRSDRRRNNPSKKVSLPTLHPCPSCGKLKKPHHACPNCGAYKS